MFNFRLLSLLLISSSVHAMDSHTSNLQLMWDDHQTGTGMHVSAHGKDKQGKPWTLREIQEKDRTFYVNEILGNEDVRKSMDSGQVVPEAEARQYVQIWQTRFAQGLPFGKLTIEQDENLVGSTQLGANEKRPGVGEVVRAFTPSAQGKGLGTAVLGFLVNEWAPALRKIGLGQDVNAPTAAVDKFKFGGEALRLIYTTARPSNVASWGSYKHFDFQPYQSKESTHTISCVGWEKPVDKPLNVQYQSLETYIIDKHFSPTSVDPLQVNVLYPMLDDKDTPRTLSYVESYKSLRFHFERELESVKH